MSPPGRSRPLWRCPGCGREFANRGQAHACGRHDLEAHFAGRDPGVRALFEEFLGRVRSLGPVTVLPEKTRIALQVRMSFAALVPRRRWLDGHLVLARRVEHPFFRRIDSLSPRNHVHHFRVERAEELDGVTELLREAYRVGEQRHLDP